MQRRNLVIVRAGDRSLHPAWLAGEGERTWDLVVSYFGTDPDLFREDDVRRIDGAGPKWPALHALLGEHPDILDGYARVWLPDDDLRTDKASINRLFDLCELHGLEVAQPSLTHDSYFGHVTTLRNDVFRLRYTNYIEVMAPCLTVDVVRRAVSLFSSNLSGWGLDFVWSRMADRPQASLAILDGVSVTHTRPVGGPNYAALRAGGISPWDELRQFCRRNGLDESPEIATHRAVLRDGTVLDVSRQKRRFAALSIAGWLPAVRRSPEARRILRRLAGMGYKALRNIPDRVSEQPLTRRGSPRTSPVSAN